MYRTRSFVGSSSESVSPFIQQPQDVTMRWRNRVNLHRLIWRQFDKRASQTLLEQIVAALRNVDSAPGGQLATHTLQVEVTDRTGDVCL